MTDTPKQFSVVIARGLWRGFEVFIEPPTASHELRAFRHFGEALLCASEISRVEGWFVQDRTKGGAE